jgi:hypothetical protein
MQLLGPCMHTTLQKDAAKTTLHIPCFHVLCFIWIVFLYFGIQIPLHYPFISLYHHSFNLISAGSKGNFSPYLSKTLMTMV